MRRAAIFLGLLFVLIVAAATLWWYALLPFGTSFDRLRPSRGPVQLTVTCGSVGQDLELCRDLLAEFSRRTGYEVRGVATPADASLHLALLRELVLTRSRSVDVYTVDVIWPGLLAEGLLDLRPYVGEEELADFFPALVENNVLEGRLLAVPYFTDAGLLYYRTDLLRRYGFREPPASWEELERMAIRIQQGERVAGNRDFWGFVWQGRQNEGLTCNALEWIASEGGGTVVAGDGRVTVDNAAAARAIDRAEAWIGTISPPETLDMVEDDSRRVWQAGDAAFMRNWPYAYALASRPGSPVAGRFGVTALPRGDVRSAATLGGWQLAVSASSRFPREAAELVRYLTSAEVQKLRAVRGSYNPTRVALYRDAEVLAANPFFERMPEILEAAVARPSTVTRDDYAEVSAAFQTAVHRVLRGDAEASEALPALQRQLSEIRGDAW